MDDILRDQIWDGVAAVLTIAAMVFAILFFVFPQSRDKLREGLTKTVKIVAESSRLLIASASLGTQKSATALSNLINSLRSLHQGIVFLAGVIFGALLVLVILFWPNYSESIIELLTPTPIVVRSESVAILTYHETYITAMKDEKGWNWELRAETDTVSHWEKFTLLYLDNRKVALMTDHGRFVSATGDDGCCNWILRAETLDRGESEEFTRVDLDDGRVAFKTNQGRYVSARSGEERWRVVAQPGGLNDWEKFELIPQK
jgi:hypothetical protein